MPEPALPRTLTKQRLAEPDDAAAATAARHGMMLVQLLRDLDLPAVVKAIDDKRLIITQDDAACLRLLDVARQHILMVNGRSTG